MPTRPLLWPTVFFILLAGLVAAVGFVGERNLRMLAGSFDSVSHTRSVLDEIAYLRADVLHAESASRGYRMSGDLAFLGQFDASRDLARARLGRLRELVADNPAQAARADSLHGDLEEKLDFHEVMHALTDPGPRNVSTREGVELMDRIDRRLDRMRDSELGLLERRRAASQQTYVLARMAGISLAVAALLLGFLVYSLFARVVQAQRAEAKQQARREVELHEAVARATEELERRAGELERSNRDLEQFAFIASHDLQEPLRKVRTFADRIDVRQAAVLGPETADSLQRIQSAAGRMQLLVENLLEYSRVTRHAQRFEEVDLGGVLADVGEDLSQMVEREGGRLEVDWLPHVWGDRTQLRQLFLNLVSNALRFHLEGIPPVVKVRGEILPPAEAGEPAVALVTVSDNGMGFEPEYAERIFGLFQRLHGRGGRFEGSGLGLAIARRIVEHHHGSIRAEGHPGEGAILRVELPLPPATDNA